MNLLLNMSIKKVQIFNFIIVLSLMSSVTSFSQTWDYKDSGTGFLLYDLSIPPGQNDVAYAVGSQYTVDSEGIIIKTADGGETWETIVSGAPHGFTEVDFFTPMRGFVVGWDNTFMITEDGGTSWQNVTAGTDIYYYSSLEFYDVNNGIAGALTNSSTLELYITTDGGDSWNLSSDTSNMAEFAACYADQNTLYSVGKDETVSKSIDGGQTWNIIYSGLPTNYYFEVFFKDADNGLVSGEDGLLRVTHDGGSTWTDYATGYHNFYGLNYVGDQLFACGTDQDVFESQDNGSTWSMIHDGPPVSTFYDFEFFDDATALICGSQGTILKVSDILILGNEDFGFNNEIKTLYNPTTSELSIISESELISNIEIYSIDGRLIKEQLFDFSKSISLNVSYLSNGNYILLINSNSNSKSVKFIKY